MSCRGRCAVSFEGDNAIADCFSGCPGVSTTGLSCEEPANWQGVCYDTSRGPSKAGTAAIFVSVIGAVFITLAVRSLDFGLDFGCTDCTDDF